MKKIINLIGVVVFSIVFALAIIPSINLREEIVSADTPIEINTITGLKSMNGDGNYKLTRDLTINSTWTSIGSKDSPFKGTFDGNGFTIKGLVSSSGSTYQGLFGYTDGAVIKNVKIQSNKTSEVFNFNFEVEQEYYAGTLVGYAVNTKISNCEVDNGTEVEKEVKGKLTIGGLVGILDNVSSIENCAVYKDIKLKENLNKGDTITVGGVVGTISNSSKLMNVVNFGDINVTREDSFTNTTYIGGIVGDISGNASQVVNCAYAGKVAIDSKLDEKDSNYLGSVAGYINAPLMEKGNIASVAYAQDIDKYGKNDGYIYKDDITKDYVSRLPEEAFRLAKFYFLGADEVYTYSFDEIEQTFNWHDAIGNGWSDNIWSIVVIDNISELRLQEFQNYTIAWSDPVDNLGVLIEPSQKSEKKYGKILELSVNISSENSGYFEIVDILYNSQSCKGNYEQLSSSSANLSKDIGYYYDSANNRYILQVKASSKTAGNAGDIGYYSFEIKAKEFKGALFIDTDLTKGGSVKFSEGLNSERVFTKQTNKMLASATAGSRYTFKQWNLYFKSTDNEEDVWRETEEGKVLNPGYLEVNEIIWKLQGGVYEKIGEEEISSGTIEKKFPIEFGKEYTNYIVKNGNSSDKLKLNQDFLFEAVYEEDPYYIAFIENTFARNGLSSIKINNKEIERNDKGSLTISDIGKNENVILEITVDANYELDIEKFIQSAKALAIEEKDIIRMSERESNEQKIYTFTFSTGLLDPAKVNDARTFSFELSAKTENTEKNSSSLGWIIGGSVGGGIALIGLTILVIWLIKRRSFGKKKIKTDYKNFY